MVAALANGQTVDIVRHAQQAQAAIAANDAASAKQELQAILKADPANSSVLANLGMVEFSQGEYAQAAHRFEAVLSHEPSLASAQAFLGMCKARLGAAEQAQKLLRDSLAQVTDKHLRVQAGLELVKSYSETGMNEKAAATLNQLMDSDPTDPEVLYAFYRIHSEMAAAALAKLTAQDPDSAWVHEVLGQNMLAQEQFSGAAEEFRKAIAVAPAAGGLHYQLGEALLRAARNEENRAAAEKEFLSELQINQRDAASLLKLTEIEMERGHSQQARVLVTRALSVRPGYAEAHATFAKILEQQGDQATAVSELETAERLAPDTKTTHYQLAQLYRVQGRTADADREIALFKRAASGEPRP